MKTYFKITLATLTLLSTTCSFANSAATEIKTAGDAAKGKEKSASCAACHGADGNSGNPLWPKLAGQHANYIEKQLTDFHDKKRNDATMTAMVAPLSPADIKDIAAFYSQQTTKPGAGNKEKVVLGKTIYKGGNLTTHVTACAACHSPTGLGNPAANYPRVSGQHAAYIAKQLKDFKKGTRANDSSSMMRSIAKRMSDEEIEAVAEYMSGLH
ncbi:MAG: c-type cytochrome [Thiotrichaceae bacterium]